MTDLTFSKQDESRAIQLREEIDKALDHAKESYAQLMWSFSRLGNVLLEVRSKYFWRLYGFSTFGEYMASIESRAGKSHTQLYSYISVAEKLSPYLTEQQIENMGISKATELCKIPKLLGIGPAKEIVESAINPDVSLSELRGEIYKKYHMVQEEKGKYFDLGPVVVTPEQKQEILDCFDLAAKVDPVIDISLPDIVRKTEIILRLCREFSGTYSQEVSYAGK